MVEKMVTVRNTTPEEGRITDSLGRRIDFRNTIVIMTSNVGAAEIAGTGTLGFAADSAMEAVKMEERLLAIAKKYFKPEFINRLDEVVVFHSLTNESLIRIIELELDKLGSKLAEKGLTLTVADEVKQFLLQKDYDAAYGARPLRRAVEHWIEDPLAEEILRGTFTGAAGISVTMDDQKILILPV